MISLPSKTRQRQIFRILTMPEGTWATQVWTALPIPLVWRRDSGTDTQDFARMPGTGVDGNGNYHPGYQLQEIARWCLPDEDRATFYLDSGTINGVTILPQTFANTAIRIQVLDDENAPVGYNDFTSGSVPWKTVFVGTVIGQSAMIRPGFRGAQRTYYYCSGALWRTGKWPLNRHSTDTVIHANGHPGYNVPLHGWFRKVLGNKSTSSTSTTGRDPFGDMASIKSYYMDHAFPIDGAGATTGKWTDEQAVRHALASSRATGEPIITTSLGDAFSGTFSWQVSPGETCYDLLKRVCNRNRGRGAVFLDWTETLTPGTGSVTLVLRSIPSFETQLIAPSVVSAGDLNMTTDIILGTGMLGADSSHVYSTQYTDVVNVDLYGDHRVTDEGVQFESRIASVYDFVEVQGEPIQVLANLNFYGGSLAKRWTTTDETAFAALTNVKDRTYSRWKNVWRRFGIPPTSQTTTPWNFTVKGTPASTFSSSINFGVDEKGTITNTPVTGNSEMTVRVLPDLPIYEGWKYDVPIPVRYDGSKDYTPAPRMSPLILYRADANTDDGSPAWANLGYAGFNFQVDDFGFLIVKGEEEQTGVRVLATIAAAGSNYQSMNVPGVTTTNGADLQKLNIVCGLELGNRVRLVYPVGSVNSTSGRRLLMTINGIHLWMGAPGCVWEADYTRASTNGYRAGALLPGGANQPYVIRDDRNDLSQIATLAWAYYGTVHNPCTWTLKDCGFLSSIQSSSADTYRFPKLGQYVGKIIYGNTQQTGQGVPLQVSANTSVTCIHYNHDNGTTTWRTDYVRYDGNAQ